MSPDPVKGQTRQGEEIARNLASLYDGVVDEYVQTFFNDLTDAPWLDIFASHTRPGGKILDVGCGPGNFAAYLVAKGFKLTGIDISPKMIEAARSLVPSGSFDVMNCSSLSYPDSSFEGVLIAYSLLHLTKADAIKSLKEMHRVLVDGGVLCLMLKDGTGEHDLPASLSPGKTCYVQLWNQEEVNNILLELGYQPIHRDIGPPTSDKELQFRKLLFVDKAIKTMGG